MGQTRVAKQRTVVRRGVLLLVLGAIMALSPIAAMADDNAGVGMGATSDAVTATPAWQQGNAYGDGNGR
jgi:hypothetical protein